MPNYFSGTNCRAMGDIYPKPKPAGYFGNVHIIDMQLYVGGELVHSWTNNGPEENSNDPQLLEAIFDIEYPLSLMVMFDSSHFPPNQNIHVRLTGHDNLNRFYDSDVDDPGNDAIARNKAILYEHPDAEFTPDAVPVANAALIGKNYDRSIINGTAWTEAQWFSDMNGANVAFYAGHGNPLAHTSGSNGAIEWDEYEPIRIAHKGSGIPPYNTGAPPINFLYLLACNCGDLDTPSTFSGACYPYYMAWGGVWMENQCWMGYTVFIVMQEISIHSEQIWPLLGDGYTVNRAQYEFNQSLLSGDAELNCWDVITKPLGPTRPMAEGDLAL